MRLHAPVYCLTALGLALFNAPAMALDPISKEAGFSGYIQPGVGYLDIKTNMVAKVLSYDLSDDTINSLNKKPDSQSLGIITPPFKIAYTFEGSETEVFLGSELTDLVTFDIGQQLGVKHNFGDVGVVQAGLLFSSLVKVWKDPYVTGQERDDTSRKTAGLQLVWDKVFGSDFELTYSGRKVDIGTESSGQFLNLTGAQQDLLDRNGTVHSASVGYTFQSGDHTLKPELVGSYEDLDGEAMKNSGVSLQLTYLYKADPLTLAVNGYVGYADFDKSNPIYGKTREDDLYGVAAKLYYKNPWNWTLLDSEPAQFFVTAAYGVVDSNIDFYKQEALLTMVGVGLFWK